MLAYAQRVAAAPHGPGSRFLQAVTAELREAENAGQFPDDILDGYDLVRRRAEQAGVDDRHVADAYVASRAVLGSDDAAIEAPEGLGAVLDELSAHARIVLVTNAPDTSLDAALDALGLRGRFDETHPSAGKPDGLFDLAEQWLAAGRLLSVGDIWVNDLEPVHRLGGDTALVGTRPGDAHPTFHANTLPGLYPDLRRWAAAEQNPILPHPDTTETESIPS